jgi:uncharacterized OB-fold protein
MTDLYLPEGVPLPTPDPSGFDAPFWEACRRHELVVQRCTNCGTFRHYPEVVCWNCQSFDHDWPVMSGKAKVFTCMNVNQAVHPSLKEAVPFNTVIVELDDAPGIRMVGNLVDAKYDEIEIGMPVQVHFEDRPDAEDVTLPLWKRAS